MIKVFCLATNAKISSLQNATLDVIRDRATEQYVSLTTPNTNHGIYAKPQGLFGSAQRPVFGLQNYQTPMTSPGFEEPVAKYLPPATASAVHYAYQKTSERSPLRRLLTNIFAYDVKPEALYKEDSLSFPAQFIANVLFITKKRLPLRLNGKKTDFDKNTNKYHIHNLSSTCNNRKQRTSKDVKVRETISNYNLRGGPATEAAIPEPEPKPEPKPEPTTEATDPEPKSITEAIAINENNTWSLKGPIRSSNRKEKKKGKHTT